LFLHPTIVKDKCWHKIERNDERAIRPLDFEQVCPFTGKKAMAKTNAIEAQLAALTAIRADPKSESAKAGMTKGND